MTNLTQSWVYEIPNHWEIRKFKFCGHIRNGQVDPKSSRFADLPLYAPNHIRSGTGEIVGEVESAAEQGAISGKYLVEAGEIVYSKIRPELRKVCIAPKRGLCSADMYTIAPSKYVDNKFLFWSLLGENFSRLAILESERVAMPKINRETLSDILFAVPPISEQKAIAQFLDRKTAAIDALIAKKQHLIELLEEKRSALINQAVTKGLNPNAPMKDSGIPWIGQIPDHWEVKKLKFTCRLETGHTPSRTEETYWIEEECIIPWVSLNDTKTLAVSDYISETKYKISPKGMTNSSAHFIDSGAVVFTRDATIGLAAITTKPMAVSQHIIAWVCLPKMNNQYLLFVIYSMEQELNRLTMGSTLKTIGMADVKELRTPVPPVSEQIEIAEFIFEQKTKIQSILHKIEHQIEKLQEYRQSVITAAVTGKLNVTQAVAP